MDLDLNVENVHSHTSDYVVPCEVLSYQGWALHYQYGGVSN